MVICVVSMVTPELNPDRRYRVDASPTEGMDAILSRTKKKLLESDVQRSGGNGSDIRIL
jgi:hypothetical protein